MYIRCSLFLSAVVKPSDAAVKAGQAQPDVMMKHNSHPEVAAGSTPKRVVIPHPGIFAG
jgi:hypothetical protein